jgi:hypothetical protein
MTQEKFKKEWEGVLRGISREEFAKAFVRALVPVVRKVYSHRWKLCLEIIKNKFPSNYHCLLFINTFRYHLDFTSYIVHIHIAAPVLYFQLYIVQRSASGVAVQQVLVAMSVLWMCNR